MVTPALRLAFVNVWHPTRHNNVDRYSVTILIPKDDHETLRRVRQAEAAAAKGSSYTDLLVEGEKYRPGDPAFAGHYVLKALSCMQPELVDSTGMPITTHSEMYSGVYGQVQLHFYRYVYGNKTGVACGLDRIRKTSDGPNLGVVPKEGWN